MTDAVPPLAAKAKLAQSRSQLLAAMGFEQLRTDADEVVAVERVPAATSGLAAIEDKINRSPIGRWWHRNALRSYLQLGEPLLENYARKHPGRLVAYSAGVGVVLWVLKPWRLLSATTVVTLLLSNTDVAGLLSGAIKKISGPHEATR